MAATGYASCGESVEPTRNHEVPCLDVSEHRGRAMGSSLHLVATGDPAITAGITRWAAQRVAELEQRWSRFIRSSEVSQLNAGAGSPHRVSADTMLLVRRALEARDLSGGRFDPTVLQAMHANGYDRTFVSIRTPAACPPLTMRDLGLGQVHIDTDTETVCISPGSGFDPGGIGKGLAADLVASEMVERGAQGALVNIGGDVRCTGDGPVDGSWVIAVGDDVAGVPNRRLELDEGGVATSTKARRRWRQQRSLTDAHHLVDTRTGRSSERAADLVVVIAASCADAEWIATSVAAAGDLPAERSMLGAATVLLTRHDGEFVTAGTPDRFVR